MLEILIGVVLGGSLIYLCLIPKLHKINKINQDIEQENNKKIEISKQLDTQIIELKQFITNLNTESVVLQTKKDEILNSIKDLQSQAEQSAENIYNINYELMQEKLSQAAILLSQQYQEAEDECKQIYAQTMRENCEEFSNEIALRKTEIQKTQEQLKELQSKFNAALEAAKREEEKQMQLDKYKIAISELDLLEINRLREIAPYFRNARAIYKIIWESYYRNNTTDLINRVIGNGTHIGVYKLTNLLNQKSYIGQAVDVGSRWKDHIKAGLGIDTPNNKLYTAMLKDGVENFSFELLEECERSELNNRETYWIEFYKTQEFGYNMTKGGSRQ